MKERERKREREREIEDGEGGLSRRDEDSRVASGT